jgi:uncharacterized membrane protein
MLLAGTSAFLWQSRSRSAGQLSAFLIRRGFWLVLLDLVVMRFAMFFSFTSAPVILSVLWALGWSMVALAALIHLPGRGLAVLSVALIALHNLADPVTASTFAGAAWVWNVLHQPGVITVMGTVVFVAYPLIPWIAVMACGYCLGPLFSFQPERRRRVLLAAGVALSAAFVVLRFINLYGDPRPWDSTSDLPLLSFLNTTKYPPSLSFLLMTLGPVLILLGLFDSRPISKWNPLLVFGRVPLFFFVSHFFLIHALAFPLAIARYGRTSFLLAPTPSMGGRLDAYPPAYGYSLISVYLVWLLVLVLMYPASRWLAALKARRQSWWLSYL